MARRGPQSYVPHRQQAPYFLTWLRTTAGFPTRVTPKACCATGNAAAGWLLPQPWVIDEKGDTVRLDDVIGGRWVVLHNGEPGNCEAWRAAGVPVIKVVGAESIPRPDSLVDSDGQLTRWLQQKGASVIAVRPDGFVYAAAPATTGPLPAPPAGFRA